VGTQLVNVLSRHMVHPTITMWGSLHTNRLTGAMVSWIVDTWSEKGIIPPLLPPKMHWIGCLRKTAKFCPVRLHADYHSSFDDVDVSSLEQHRSRKNGSPGLNIDRRQTCAVSFVRRDPCRHMTCSN